MATSDAPMNIVERLKIAHRKCPRGMLPRVNHDELALGHSV